MEEHAGPAEQVVRIKLDVSSKRIEALNDRAERIMDKLDHQAEQGGPLAAILAELLLEPDRPATRGDLARAIAAVARAVVPRAGR
jgi:hypothetical protein